MASHVATLPGVKMATEIILLCFEHSYFHKIFFGFLKLKLGGLQWWWLTVVLLQSQLTIFRRNDNKYRGNTSMCRLRKRIPVREARAKRQQNSQGTRSGPDHSRTLTCFVKVGHWGYDWLTGLPVNAPRRLVAVDGRRCSDPRSRLLAFLFYNLHKSHRTGWIVFANSSWWRTS